MILNCSLIETVQNYAIIACFWFLSRLLCIFPIFPIHCPVDGAHHTSFINGDNQSLLFWYQIFVPSPSCTHSWFHFVCICLGWLTTTGGSNSGCMCMLSLIWRTKMTQHQYMDNVVNVHQLSYAKSFEHCDVVIMREILLVMDQRDKIY